MKIYLISRMICILVDYCKKIIVLLIDLIKMKKSLLILEKKIYPKAIIQ